MTGAMFEHWQPAFDPPPYRVVDPPQAVIVNVAVAFSQVEGLPANTLPLRVRAEALALDVQVPGRLSGWARSTRGFWLCNVSFAIPTGNGLGYLEVNQWVSAAAVRPCK